MWEDIVILHKEFQTFQKLVEKRMLKRRDMNDIEVLAGNIISPDTPFLEVYLDRLNIFLVKASEFIARCLAYHEEVNGCMQAVLDIHKELEIEDTKRKRAGELLTAISARINSIEANINESIISMKSIKKEFITLQVEYQHSNN